MTDTTIAAQAARVATENEAAHEIIAQAAPNNPDPTTDDGGQRTDRAAADPSSKPAPAEAGVSPLSSDAKPLERVTAADRSRADIAARFKQKRASHGGQVEFHGDMRDPSQTYGPFGLAPEQTTEDGGQTTEEKPPAQNQPTQAPPVEQDPPSSVLRRPNRASSRSRCTAAKRGCPRTR